MPDFGIVEGLAALGEALGVFGGAEAAGAGAAAAAGGAEAAGATSLADIVGTGTGLFGGATGLEGTALAGGFTGGADALGATAGLGALGTAADFMAAPGASALGGAGVGFGPAADAAASQAANTGLASGPGSVLGGGPGPLAGITPPPQPQAMGGTSSFGGSSPLSPNVANANAGASVFDTGAAPLQASPGGASASSLAPPAGVTTPLGVDPTAAATGGNAAGTAAKTSSISELLGKTGSGIMDTLTKNPLQTAGIALGAGGLGYNILQGQKLSENQKALSSAAGTAANTGQTALNAGLPIAQANNATGTGLINSGEALQNYLSTGQLPAAYQSQVDQAINDAKTRAISNAAASGMPTDPTLNTSLATSLASIENQRAAMTTQVAQTLFNAGSSNINAGSNLTTGSASSLIGAGQTASGLSGSLYQALVQNDTTQAANTGKAIATLAAALNGKSGTGGINISTG